uniref:Uncharacterized protein n=1 Tax=Anguilla anguilla TaxID=7936 RepID=A0A0E9XIF9_ANGAN
MKICFVFFTLMVLIRLLMLDIILPCVYKGPSFFSELAGIERTSCRQNVFLVG